MKSRKSVIGKSDPILLLSNAKLNVKRLPMTTTKKIIWMTGKHKEDNYLQMNLRNG